MKTIMALIDFSVVTPAVVKLGRDVARAFGADLVLLHVVERETEYESGEEQEDTSQQAIAKRSHKRELEIMCVALKKEGINTTMKILEAKPPSDTVSGKILAEIAHALPQLVIVGSHGHGRLYQMLAGSVSDTVMHKAGCPVLLVPSRMSQTNK